MHSMDLTHPIRHIHRIRPTIHIDRVSEAFLVDT